MVGLNNHRGSFTLRSGLELIVVPLVREAPAFFADPATVLLDQDVVADEFMTSATVGSLVVEARGFGDGLLNVIVAGLKVVGGDNLIPRLPLVVTDGDQCSGKTVSLGNCNGGVENAVRVGDHHRNRAVEKLLATSSPAAVVRGIASVVILAVHRVLRRRLGAHVRKPIVEPRFSFAPTVADRDASPSIVIVLLGLRGMATADHVLPGSVEWMISLVHGSHDFMSDEILQGAF